MVVVAGDARRGDRSARVLARFLGELGIQVTYLGREDDACRIASAVAAEHADAVEICLGGTGGVLVLRALLRALIEIGRRDVSIVVHRVE